MLSGAQKLTTPQTGTNIPPSLQKTAIRISTLLSCAQALKRSVFFVPATFLYGGSYRSNFGCAVARYGSTNSVWPATLMTLSTVRGSSLSLIEYNLMSQQLSAEFHGTTLSIVEHNNEPYVSAKQISDAIGLDWKTQYRKLNSNRQRWSMVKMTMVGKDKKQRTTVAMPLRKLPGWLMTIQPNKLKNDLRSKVIQYQEQCDDVLWAHWNKSQSTTPAIAQSQTLPAAINADETITTIITMRPDGTLNSQTVRGEVAVIPAQAIKAMRDKVWNSTMDVQYNTTKIVDAFASSVITPSKKGH